MRAGQFLRLGLVYIITTTAILPSGVQAAAQTPVTPPSQAPALDQAAADLASGRLEQARAGFKRLARDASQTPFVRALAQLGLAQTSWMREDTEQAITMWDQLAEDPTVARPFRDRAKMQAKAAQRIQKGLPGYDPDAQRVKLPIIPKPAVTFYVAASGRDINSGSKAHPFQSLTRARNAIRIWKRAHADQRSGSILVIVQGGSYPVTQPLELNSEDSGSAAAPIVYQAEPGQQASFCGGVNITAWQPIADKQRVAQLAPSVRMRVLQADLKALGVTALGDATALRRRPELFCDGVPQTLARWPNQGFVKTGEIRGEDTFTVWNSIAGCKDGKFNFVEDRPATWINEPDVRLYGYWFWDWFEEYQRVDKIDDQARTFTLSPPFSRYGYRKDQRYYAVNVFRELDQPGEWYLDRRNSTVYWLPPTAVDAAKVTTVFSVYDQPFVTMDNVEHVIVQGLCFQESRANGIHIRGGAHALVAGCTFKRLGGDAVVIKGGQDHGVFGCTMHTLGCAGMDITGGDRKELTRGGHFVENCTVYDISRLKRTYSPAVRLDGCANRIAHNRFERMPSSALRIEGNDHMIELNIVRKVVQESDDQGGLDMFGNPLYRGVVIRWNLWKDIGGGTDCGAAGVRLDDMISGVMVHGNVFQRCGAVKFGGVQIHGGKENLIDNNCFIDCFAGISFSRWSAQRWLESIERFQAQVSSRPYAARYPELAQLRQGANINVICRNIFARTAPMLLRDGQIQQTALNLVTDQMPEIERLSHDRGMQSETQFRPILLNPIPTHDIGPYAHPWRASPAQAPTRAPGS
jgi:hypothetical protein